MAVPLRLWDQFAPCRKINVGTFGKCCCNILSTMCICQCQTFFGEGGCTSSRQTSKQSNFNFCSQPQGVPRSGAPGTCAPVQPRGTKAEVTRLPSATQGWDSVQTVLGPASMAVTQERSDTSSEVLLMSLFLLAGNSAEILDMPLWQPLAADSDQCLHSCLTSVNHQDFFIALFLQKKIKTVL